MRDVGIFAPIRNGGQADQEAKLNRIKEDIIDTEADIRAQRRIIERQAARKNGIEESQEYKDLASRINEIKNVRLPSAKQAKSNANDNLASALFEQKRAEKNKAESWIELTSLAGDSMVYTSSACAGWTAGSAAGRYLAIGTIGVSVPLAAVAVAAAGMGILSYAISSTLDDYHNEKIRQANDRYNEAVNRCNICAEAIRNAEHTLEIANSQVVNYEGQERNYNQFQADINSCVGQIQEANQEIQRLEGVLEGLRQADRHPGNDRLVDQLAPGAA